MTPDLKRKCEFCERVADARFRRCCERGYFADGGTPERLQEERDYAHYRKLGA